MTRSRWAAIGAAVAVTLGSGGIGFVRAAEPATSEVTPIAPCRLMDTRAAATAGDRRVPLGAGETVIVDVFGSNGDCDIPSGVTAIDVNLTALGATAARTFVTAYPAGAARPNASQLNPSSSTGVSANSTSITLSSAGQFALFNNAGNVNIIVDVLAYYTRAEESGALPGAGGTTGPQGPAGPAGAPGPAGADGVDGVDGLDGAVGPQGPAGPAGADGAPGPAGADGAPGPAGPAGADGAPGVDGADGAVGPQGPVGPAGADGAPGVDGVDGAPGVDGAVGPQGPVGPAGADGATGPVGPAGADGAPGVDGQDGPQGPIGPAGADGVDGENGADGEDGVSGYERVDGAVSAAGNPVTRIATATCPAGKVAVGGGFQINSTPTGTREAPFATRSAPTSDTVWSVTVENGAITRTGWSVQAFAVCVFA